VALAAGAVEVDPDRARVVAVGRGVGVGGPGEGGRHRLGFVERIDVDAEEVLAFRHVADDAGFHRIGRHVFERRSDATRVNHVRQVLVVALGALFGERLLAGDNAGVDVVAAGAAVAGVGGFALGHEEPVLTGHGVVELPVGI
jgi:hypothetical protein